MGAATAPQFLRARYAHGGARGDVMVLSSRLHPPAGCSGSVARRDLPARLNESVSAKLVVVSAPVGWGTTSFLCDWCSAGEATRTAWLSVEQDDSVPARFWAHVIAAVANVYPGAGAPLQVLTAPGTKDAEGVLRPLTNDLERLAAPVPLVLGRCLVSRCGRWATRLAPNGGPGRPHRDADPVGRIGAQRDGSALGCVKRRDERGNSCTIQQIEPVRGQQSGRSSLAGNGSRNCPAGVTRRRLRIKPRDPGRLRNRSRSDRAGP
jgi:hypothetical protein